MNAEIITIGDEILIGQIVDTNSQWIATELNKIGVSVYQITSIQDDKTQILEAIKAAEKRTSIVIITGGLGPTKDDITKLALATYFNDELILNTEIVEHIKKMFAKINYPFTEVNKNQALLPTKCLPLMNYLGTAPGMWFQSNNKVIVSLPGVPNEMKGLMTTKVIPKLKETFKFPYIIHKTIVTYGMGESMVADRIEKWERNLPDFIKLAYLPSYGRLRLRLTAKGSDKIVLQDSIEENITSLEKIISDIIVGYDEDDTIENVVANLLTKENKTLSVAESCTGGNISKKITAIPGASNYFLGGVISYSAKVKEEQLGVKKEVISKYSVVSEQVAEEMAIGVQQKMKSDYAIATTGNAGPTTDKTDKTVGVVFIAIATPAAVYSKEFYFGKPREKVIERASNKALEMLRKEILKNR